MTDSPSSPVAGLTLRQIDAHSVPAICSLQVRPDQQAFVASNAFSLAQALFDPRAWYRGIYAGEIPVGFVMLCLDPAGPEYSIWRLMIDARYQAAGYGRAALELVLAHARTLPHARELLVSCVPGDNGPQAFYERCGFSPTGQMLDGEVILHREL